MNSEKVLLEIVCVGLGRSFDCTASRQITAKNLCHACCSMVWEQVGVSVGDPDKMLLVSAKLEKKLYPGQTLDEQGIDSGDTLYMV